MESNPCEKTTGEVVPSTITLTPAPSPGDLAAYADAAAADTTAGVTSADSQTQVVEDESAALCRHIDARGHRCRMLVVNDEDGGLCTHHAQRRLQAKRIPEAAEELLACGTHFGDAASVNRFLGALVRQVTLKRIPRRDAVTLAYLCQLLLNSLGAIDREEALRLEEKRVQALNAPKHPPRILWDIPGPPYEPTAEEVLAEQIRRERSQSR